VLFILIVLSQAVVIVIALHELTMIRIGRVTVKGGGKKRPHVLIAVAGIVVVILFEGFLMVQMLFDAAADPWTLYGGNSSTRQEVREVLVSTPQASDIAVVRVGGVMSVVMPEKYVGHYNHFTKSIWLRDDKSVGSFVHEVGHHVWYAQDESLRDAWRGNWDSAMDVERACAEREDTEGECAVDVRFERFVSAYARTSVEEDFAESYQAYREGWDVGEWRRGLLQGVVWG
jgi:hypothetical protein